MDAADFAGTAAEAWRQAGADGRHAFGFGLQPTTTRQNLGSDHDSAGAAARIPWDAAGDALHAMGDRTSGPLTVFEGAYDTSRVRRLPAPSCARGERKTNYRVAKFILVRLR